MPKMRKVDSLGAVFHFSGPVNVKFGTGSGPAAIMCHFGPLSKNNTGTAALPAGLSIIIIRK